MLRLQIMYGFFATLHWTLAYRFLIGEVGLSVERTILVAGAVYLTSTLVLFLIPAFDARRAIRVGFFFRVLTIVPYWLWPTEAGIFVGSVAFGLAMVLFWIPYNLMYFEHRAKTDAANMSAVYGSIAPFVDVVAALLAGYLVIQAGWSALFGAAVLAGLVPLVVSFRLTPRGPVRMDVWARTKRLPRLKTMMLLDGVNQGVVWPAMPIVTLLFIEGTFEYASFFAGLGLVGAVSAIFLGRFSDRTARRAWFLLPFAFVYGVANAFSATAVGALAWGVWRGVSTFSSHLFDPFKMAIFLDQATDITDLYIGRELLLNVGRMIGVVILLLFAHFWTLQYAFAVAAVIGFVYPVLVEVKDLYPAERLLLKPFRTTWRQ